MIRLSHVKKSFADARVLKDISFTVAKGEKVSLVGPGGCGKSLILKILLGLIPPDDGEVALMDMDMVQTPESDRLEILRKVGMAFQQGALFDFMTVAQNMTFAMSNMTALSGREMKEKVQLLLDGVKLSRTADMFPFELSGGMQRRVGIARALCTDPVVAIFDEPTSGLDPVTSTIILNMIAELAKAEKLEGDSCQMVVTSNVEIGIRFADRVVVINEGRVVADGPWRELLLSGPPWVSHFLGVRFIGLDKDYALELDLPQPFINKHWQ
jgi:phospholipid/cholesterol/gamma-HCH transport system ATP-binding protein